MRQGLDCWDAKSSACALIGWVMLVSAGFDYSRPVGLCVLGLLTLWLGRVWIKRPTGLSVAKDWYCVTHGAGHWEDEMTPGQQNDAESQGRFFLQRVYGKPMV